MRSDRTDPVAEAVERFQSGTDRDGSFRFLYLTYFPALERFFARKGFRPEDCLDLTQETFFGIYKGLDAYRSEARFDTWLYKVATSAYLKKLRAASTAKRKGKEVSQEDMTVHEPLLESPATQLDGLLDDERRQAMRAAVERLPEQMRQCLTLRLYHQLAYREIATVMKVKIDTVKAHLFKARKRLKEELAAYSLDDLNFCNEE